MKKIIIGMLCLSSLTALAATSEKFELTRFAQEDLTVKTAVKNPDQSVTFKNIRVKRGDQSYEIDASQTSFGSVCKLLGYEQSLTGAGMNGIEINGPGYWILASLNANGQYLDTVRTDRKTVKVTCFNRSEFKPVTDFSKVDNADGSVSISNIVHLRGDQSFGIDGNQTSYKSICKLLGYENSLSGAGLNTIEINGPGYWMLASLDVNGQYLNIVRTDKRTTKVTCFSGSEPELIVLVDGARYRRQQP